MAANAPNAYISVDDAPAVKRFKGATLTAIDTLMQDAMAAQHTQQQTIDGLEHELADKAKKLDASEGAHTETVRELHRVEDAFVEERTRKEKCEDDLDDMRAAYVKVRAENDKFADILGPLRDNVRRLQEILNA
jgi:septal ring factor EnvC (AmiA/AmiB activator)